MTEQELITSMAEVLQEMEWQYKMVRCGRGCCDKPAYVCPSCEARQEDGHSTYCALAMNLTEAKSYLNPPAREGMTFWDWIQDETVPCHES